MPGDDERAIVLPRQEDPAIPASSEEYQDIQVSTYAPGRPDAEGAAGRSPGHGCQPVIVLPEALAPAQVIQISRFCVPSRSRAGSRRAVHIGRDDAPVEVAIRDTLQRELPPGGHGRPAVVELKPHRYLAAPAT